MENYPLRYSFIVSYVIDDSYGYGIIQALKYEHKRLYLLSIDENSKGKRWIPADACVCRKILSTYVIKEILQRDDMKLDDLAVVPDFGWKYLQSLSNKDELC